MKRLIRYFSLFLCFALLFTVFSVSASAESVDISGYHFTQTSTIKLWDNSEYYFSDPATSYQIVGFSPNDNEKTAIEGKQTRTAMELASAAWYYSTYLLSNENDKVLLEKGKNYSIDLSDLYFSALVHASTKYYVRNPNVISVAFVDYEGTYHYIDDYNTIVEANNPNFSISMNYKPQKNIKSIVIVAKSYLSEGFPSFTTNYGLTVSCYWGEWSGDNRYQLSINEESEEAGLLKESNNLLNNIKNGITNLFNSIVELPSKIWSFIENGLKSLFVPSEEVITEFKGKMETMLSEKLGAVYQVIDITLESWNNITANDITNTIEIPLTTINLPNNNSFSFGGYTVAIVPNGFEFIVETIKLLVGIACSILFINGLRKRYDEVMGVEQ